MNQHSKEGDDNKVALFFRKVPSIIWEVILIVLGVASLIVLFRLVWLRQPELQKAITLKPAVGDRVKV